MLTPQEAGELFGILRTLTREGISIIFISHKLNEVLEIADRVTVLRRGKLIETLPIEGATEETLARLMVGREVLLRVDKAARGAGRAVLLEVDDLSVRDDRGIEKVDGVSFDVRARRDRRDRGCRRQRPVGADRRDHGPAQDRERAQIAIAGRGDRRARRARRTSRPAFGHIPEDRQHRGLVLDFSIAENIGLHDFRKPPNSRYGWLYPRRLVEQGAKH